MSATLSPSVAMPELDDLVLVRFLTADWEPERLRIAIAGHPGPDGSVDLVTVVDTADEGDEGHEWTLYPCEVAEGRVRWEPTS
ncbi:MAG TPA: hypothetical protein VGW74_05460 [Propionibacteriaceae bacterium]|nr:hypothetical protein [Propionibacteriaceae bacterium]